MPEITDSNSPTLLVGELVLELNTVAMCPPVNDDARYLQRQL